jgi:hypothetical protein
LLVSERVIPIDDVHRLGDMMMEMVEEEEEPIEMWLRCVVMSYL